MLFHSIDKSCHKTCYILTVLELAESYAHAMMSALLPPLEYTKNLEMSKGHCKMVQNGGASVSS